MQNSAEKSKANGKHTGKGGSVEKSVQQSTSHEKKFRPTFGVCKWLPSEYAECVLQLQETIGRPVLLFVQNEQDDSHYSMVSTPVSDLFLDGMLPSEKVAVVIDSLGGLAHCAFQIATAIRRRCGGFDAYIPERAKSAATLLAMGADKIYMSPDAHLGPLDAQVFDHDMASRKSALEVVQAVERLRVESLETLEATCMTIKMGTGLPYTTVLPFAIENTVGLMRPLLEKVDVVQYMRMSRSLKVGEEYAAQLMAPIYGPERAKHIANHFVRGYPDHGFVITPDEARTAVKLPDRKPFGLNVAKVEGDVGNILSRLAEFTGSFSAYGQVEEVRDEK